MHPRYHVRTTRHEDNSVKFELMDGDTKLDDITPNELHQMALHFISALSWMWRTK